VDEIVGRQEDILFTPEKGYVGRMDPAYKGLTGIVKSKIIQHSEKSLEVQNVVDSNYTNAIEKQLIYNIRERLGEKIEIVVHQLDEIPLGPSGKFKAVQRKFKI
jgi:phenylacetate-CoA ligase